MKQQKLIFLLLLVTIVLSILLATGIGYADNIEITDERIASPEHSDFKVEFTGKTSYAGDGIADVNITGKTTATMNITGLKKAGDSVTVTFNVKNTSNDFYAVLSKSITNSNTEFFKVTTTFEEDKIGPKGRKTEIHINVKLIKTPIYKDESAVISVKVTATPEEV